MSAHSLPNQTLEPPGCVAGRFSAKVKGAAGEEFAAGVADRTVGGLIRTDALNLAAATWTQFATHFRTWPCQVGKP